MQLKIIRTAILLSLVYLIMLFKVISSNAMTFEMSIPTFGLNCNNHSAALRGKVKYVVEPNGKAMQYSEYAINGTYELDLEIPFISDAYAIPQFKVSVNGKTVTGEVCYGEKYLIGGEPHFYSSKIEENLTGTLYTVIMF